MQCNKYQVVRYAAVYPHVTLKQMNKTVSGEVTLWEFREYFDLPDDRSTTRLFRCFDEDRDNRIGFLELVVGLWTYCECENSSPIMQPCFQAPQMSVAVLLAFSRAKSA